MFQNNRHADIYAMQTIDDIFRVYFKGDNMHLIKMGVREVNLLVFQICTYWHLIDCCKIETEATQYLLILGDSSVD